jgi:hypothetical protein
MNSCEQLKIWIIVLTIVLLISIFIALDQHKRFMKMEDVVGSITGEDFGYVDDQDC